MGSRHYKNRGLLSTKGSFRFRRSNVVSLFDGLVSRDLFNNQFPVPGPESIVSTISKSIGRYQVKSYRFKRKWDEEPQHDFVELCILNLKRTLSNDLMEISNLVLCRRLQPIPLMKSQCFYSKNSLVVRIIEPGRTSRENSWDDKVNTSDEKGIGNIVPYPEIINQERTEKELLKFLPRYTQAFHGF
jgi:hypothetical protein